MFIHLAEKNTSPGRNHMLFLFTASSSECDNTMSVIRCWLCHTYLIGSNIVIKILYFTIWIRRDFTRLIKILESLWVANNDNNNKSLLYLKQEYMRKDIWIQAQKYEMVLLQLWAHMRVAPGSPAGSPLATNGSCPKPLTNHQSHSHCLWNVYILMLEHFSFHRKYITSSTAQICAHWVDFTLTVVFQGHKLHDFPQSCRGQSYWSHTNSPNHPAPPHTQNHTTHTCHIQTTQPSAWAEGQDLARQCWMTWRSGSLAH